MTTPTQAEIEKLVAEAKRFDHVVDQRQVNGDWQSTRCHEVITALAAKLDAAESERESACVQSVTDREGAWDEAVTFLETKYRSDLNAAERQLKEDKSALDFLVMNCRQERERAEALAAKLDAAERENAELILDARARAKEIAENHADLSAAEQRYESALSVHTTERDALRRAKDAAEKRVTALTSRIASLLNDLHADRLTDDDPDVVIRRVIDHLAALAKQEA